MDRDRIDRLHRLTEFVQQPIDVKITNDPDHLLLEASNVFKTKVFLTMDQETAIDLLKAVFADTNRLLSILFDTTKPGYMIKFNKPVVMSTAENLNREPYFSMNPQPVSSDTRASFELWGPDPDAIDYVPKLSQEVEYLAIAGIVFDLIEGIPVDRLKRCLECERLFIQQTGREKKYCSDYCKNKRNIRLRGEQT